MNEFAMSRLIDFFKYFSRDFLYNTGVASIRAGLLKKETKGWQNDVGGFSPSAVPHICAFLTPFTA